MGVFHDVMSGRISNLSNYEELAWRTVFPEYESRSSAGVTINERNATSVSDYFKCVHVISEDIAKLPKKVMRQARIAGRETRQDAPTHPLYWLIHAEPNPLMTSFRYFETGIIHLLTWGNWYSYIQRGTTSGRVQALWPLCPHLVRIQGRRPEDPPDVRYWYIVIDPATNREQRFYQDEILHVPFFSYDGIQGQSPVRLLMETLGVAKAQERYAAHFFGNSARISGIVSPGDNATLTKDQVQQLQESLSKYASVNNSGRLAVIQGNIKWQQISMPNDEAQFLESRQFSRHDIAGMLRIMPHKISDFTHSAYANIEHSEIAHVTDALQSTVERCEQEFERALLAEYDKGKIFIHFELDGLKRGDTAARTAYYQARFNMGSISQNEIREKENEEPFEGGDDHWIQLNMVPLELAKTLLTAKSTALPSPASPETVPASPKTAPKRPGNSVNDAAISINDVDAIFGSEMQARVLRSYGPVMEDAIGRVLHRKPAERERYVPLAFAPILASLMQLFPPRLTCGEVGGGEFESKADEALHRAKHRAAFTEAYLQTMGKRAIDWQDLNVIETELDQMITALTEEYATTRINHE